METVGPPDRRNGYFACYNGAVAMEGATALERMCQLQCRSQALTIGGQPG
jgi:hypothetical protein